MKNNQYIICIGAGNSQIPYIKKAKDLGYRVFCTDRNPEAPGFKVADGYVVSSTVDYVKTPGKILEKLSSSHIKAVIAPCTGLPFKTEQEIKRLLKMPYVGKKETDILMDKLLLREHLNRIHCSQIDIYNDQKELNEHCFPLVEKPRFGGMGGRGITFFCSFESYKKSCPFSGRKQDYVCERYINGREIAADAVWDGKNIVFLSLGWTLFDVELGIIVGSTSQRDPLLDPVKNKIKEVLECFCLSMRLPPEFLSVDIILAPDNVLHVIEVEFVPFDDVYLTEEAFQYDLVGNYVLTHLGDTIQKQPKRLKNTALVCSVKDKTNAEEINKVSSKSIGRYFSVPEYEVQTKKGQMLITGYNIVSHSDAGQLMQSVKNMCPAISLERFTYVGF